MRVLSEAELAAESGATVELVRRLVAIGALRPLAPGRYEAVDLYRVAEIQRLQHAGIDLDVIREAIEREQTSLEYVGRLYLEPAPRSGRPYSEFLASLGARAHLVRPIYAAFGLPEPDPDLPLRQDEEDLIGRFVEAWAPAGDDAQAFVRAARLLGEGVRRLVEGTIELYGNVIAGPTLAARGTSEEVNRQVGEHAARIAGLVPPMLVWLEQRHLEHAVTAANLGSFEEALERDGRLPARERRPTAIAFVDLAGFTQLTEEVGDERAGRWAARLGELAHDAAHRRDGRVIKLLGDGVLLRLPDPERGVAAALELVAAVDRDGLPRAHGGVEAGPIVEREGDVYGRTVNLAARIGGAAVAGQVLVGAGVVGSWSGSGVDFRPVGSAALKGFAAPVPLWQATAAVA